MPAQHRTAFRMILANESFPAISKETGLSRDEILEIKRKFENTMRQDHYPKFKAGAHIDATGDCIFSLDGTQVDEAITEREFCMWLRKLGIVPDETQGKKPTERSS